MLHDRAHTPLKMPLALLSLILAVSLGSASLTRAGDTWDGGYGSPEEACRNRVNEEGAFRFSRAEVKGNVAYCFTIAKKDGKDEYHDASVTRDEPAEEPKKDAEDGNKKNPAPEPAKASAPPPPLQKMLSPQPASKLTAQQNLKPKSTTPTRRSLPPPATWPCSNGPRTG